MTTSKSKWRSRRRRLFGSFVCGYVLFFMLGGCADSFLLFPSHQPIDAGGATPVEVFVPGRPPVDAYVRRKVAIANGAAGTAAQEPQAYLLILDGNGGRAETAVNWGDDAARGHAVEVWSVNYPGYGRSAGPARLAGVAPAALATFDAIHTKAPNKPIIIWGGSLGTTAALHVAAKRPVAGLILSNPPPLRQVIIGHHGWWNLWLLALPVSRGVPAELDSLANAAAVKCPVVIASANNDRVVPPKYQQQVIDALPGPKQVVRLPNAGHDTPASKANPTAWYDAVDWLWGQVLPPSP